MGYTTADLPSPVIQGEPIAGRQTRTTTPHGARMADMGDHLRRAHGKQQGGPGAKNGPRRR